MSYFVRRGDTFWPQTDAGMNVKTLLPPGNYVVRMDEFKRLYLADAAPFKIPDRVYGSLPKQRARIVETFFARPTTTGVLLSGEKGSGKTLLAKTVCAELAEKHDIPTILVNQPFSGDDFNIFIQTIEQPAVVMFDEFEKVYKREDQESLLTLLDGVITTKKLFILTCNDQFRIDNYMRNRPGRIYYFIPFRGLGKEFIREYCEDTLAQKEYTEKLCAISDLFDEFNFDMLKAVVEEMNRYGDTPEAALEILNVKPEACAGGQYTVRLIHKSREIPADAMDENKYVGNPFGRTGIPVEFRSETSNEDDPFMRLYFSENDFVRYDAANGVFTFEQGDTVLLLTKVQRKDVNYLAF